MSRRTNPKDFGRIQRRGRRRLHSCCRRTLARERARVCSIRQTRMIDAARKAVAAKEQEIDEDPTLRAIRRLAKIANEQGTSFSGGIVFCRYCCLMWLHEAPETEKHETWCALGAYRRLVR